MIVCGKSKNFITHYFKEKDNKQNKIIIHNGKDKNGYPISRNGW
jgi:hypothetical protein